MTSLSILMLSCIAIKFKLALAAKDIGETNDPPKLFIADPEGNIIEIGKAEFYEDNCNHR